MGQSNNSSEEVFLKPLNVKKATNQRDKTPNEILKRFIYIKAKSNINKFATELGISRQYLFGIISGYMQVSIGLARRICDKLGVEDTRLIFPDGSLHYPDIVTADKYSSGETTGEKSVVETNDGSSSNLKNGGREENEY